MKPIYIPSKGRPNCLSSKKLSLEGVPHTVVCEPQEEAQYREHNKDVLVLPDNNRGVAFARNFIKDYANGLSQEWIWIIDDDVRDVRVHVSGRNKVVGFTLPMVEADGMLALEPSVALFSFDYNQYYWNSRPPYFKRNSYCEVFVCLNTKRSLGVRYDQSLILKSDRDFCLQLLSKGWETLRYQRFGFSTPTMGSNVGGLKREYAERKDLISIDAMVKKWPGLCRKVVKQTGVVDLKIDWNFFSPKKTPA
jgi:glycosyltransferase involved in cell wall biosynthesis